MDLEFMWPKPDLRDRKGSLTLRAQQQMIYGRPTLVYNWHCNRETEPKDYDVHAIPLGDKNLHHSTYKRLGTSENDWRTTTDVQLSQICLKKDYEEREIRKSLVNVDNFHTVDKRDTRRPERGYGAVLPHHPLDHKKMFLETTYNSEFVAPYRYTPAYWSSKLANFLTLVSSTAPLFSTRIFHSPPEMSLPVYRASRLQEVRQEHVAR
ncbi:protein C9orf135 homolog isoform X2 [Rhinatrema bivittatum]|uniref:protein C9orf135 homolog isoform X2 n=1 Tax=Rhinatrema bivittatum TaxID=194408 RepID=UPI00112A97DE|nr:protein C9orf135 homolog isoform X2 [Rhinatrema bivittatum]